MNLNRLTDSITQALVRSADYREQARNAASEKPSCHYVIAISREAGAGGTTVARAVGKLLGWPVYDQELVERISKEMGTQVDVLKLIDEKPMNWLEQCVINLVSEYNLSHDSYMVHLIATVQALAQQGHCVIVGRGATFVLPHDTTLTVRLVGNLTNRIAHIQEQLNLSEKDAARWVEKKNRERQDFVKRHFGKDVTDPHLYDLVLNTSRMSFDECAQLIVARLHEFQGRKQAAAALVRGGA